MIARSTLAAIRFGTGLRPGMAAVAPEELLAGLTASDSLQARFPQDSYATRVAFGQEVTRLNRARRESDAANEAFLAARRQLRADILRQLAITLARGTAAEAGAALRERLVWFWADHFTTVGGRSFMRGAIAAYVEDAIRPHVAGRFGDMLEAAILHPVMVLYLDQERSYGPNSVTGLRRGASLNENLARELLELHTLGVNGGYTQTDVRQMAELLTGLGVERGGGLAFRPGNAEPGAEQILGQNFGGAPVAELSEIRTALRALALRPETARHISGKLADHFLSDTPDRGLIDALAATWMDSGGDLARVMGTMLAQPAAWADVPGRVKRPLHYIVSGLRALGVAPDRIAEAPTNAVNRIAALPMSAMGQTWQGASGPDGYFDDDREWIRPQSLAARIGWAMVAPAELRPRLPDPRAFVQAALSDAAPPDLVRAASRAETRAEGIGIVLASPEFQRS